MFLLSLLDPSALAPPPAAPPRSSSSTVSHTERAHIINSAMRLMEQTLPGGWRTPAERTEARAALEAVDTSTLTRAKMKMQLGALADVRLMALFAARGYPPPTPEPGRRLRRHAGRPEYCGGF